jgi:hypothetical protein
MNPHIDHDDSEPDDTSGADGGRSLPPELAREVFTPLDRYTVLDKKLEGLLATAPTPPAWRDAWLRSCRGRKRTLGGPPQEQAEPEERLAVWQAVRDSGALPEDAGLFLVADQVEFLTELQVGETMEQIEAATDALWEERGLGEWRSQTGRDSDDFLEFQRRCPATWDRLYVDLLLRHGEADLARLYRADRERFDERVAAGRAYFYPPPPEEPPAPPPPRWAQDFVAEVAASGCIAFADGGQPGTYGYRVGGRAGSPEIRFNLTPAAFVGGPHDGEVMLREFALDVERLQAVFDEVHATQWFPFGSGLGAFVPHVRVVGMYRGHRLGFYFLSGPLDPDEIEEDPDPLPAG